MKPLLRPLCWLRTIKNIIKQPLTSLETGYTDGCSYIEIEDNRKVQKLECEVCGKISIKYKQ